MKRSLHRRLTVTHTLVALLAVILVALLASGLIVQAYRVLAEQQARNVSQRLADQLGPYYARSRSWDNIERDFRQRLEDSPVLSDRRVILADTQNIVVFDSADRLEGQLLPQRLLRQASSVRFLNRPVGMVVIPYGSDGQNNVELGFIRSIIGITIVGSLVAGGVALLVALLVSRQLTKPLRSLTDAVRRLASGKQHEPIDPPREIELAELAGAFNTMAAELSRQEALRRQLVADIAHELRTPLSVLRLQVESLEDGVEQPTPEVFSSLSHEVGLLSRLIGDLRLLSLADAGQLQLAIEAIDAQSLIEQAALSGMPRARQEGIDLRVEANGALPPIKGDRQRMTQVLGNLVENALRYTPSGGSVTLRARRADAEATSWRATDARITRPLSQLDASAAVVIEVSDTGPGIAPDDLEHIFERFYRADRARARETGGSGLGLAIVQRLVESQGGQVGVKSALGQGTTFWVTLPTA